MATLISSGRASGFTCITCAVAFQDADLQRDHYKTDWHRYNLKRKVAELSPVTLDDFTARMSKHEAQMKAMSGEEKVPTGYCVACTKNFATVKALENHKKSRKHLVIATMLIHRFKTFTRLKVFAYNVGIKLFFGILRKYFVFLLN